MVHSRLFLRALSQTNLHLSPGWGVGRTAACFSAFVITLFSQTDVTYYLWRSGEDPVLGRLGRLFSTQAIAQMLIKVETIAIVRTLNMFKLEQRPMIACEVQVRSTGLDLEMLKSGDLHTA